MWTHSNLISVINSTDNSKLLYLLLCTRHSFFGHHVSLIINPNQGKELWNASLPGMENVVVDFFPQRKGSVVLNFRPID